MSANNRIDILQRIRDLTTNRCSSDVAGAVRVNRVDLPAEPLVRAQPIDTGAEREISLGDPSAQLRSEILPERSMLPWILGGAAVVGAALLLLPRA